MVRATAGNYFIATYIQADGVNDGLKLRCSERCKFGSSWQPTVIRVAGIVLVLALLLFLG